MSCLVKLASEVFSYKLIASRMLQQSALIKVHIVLVKLNLHVVTEDDSLQYQEAGDAAC